MNRRRQSKSASKKQKRSVSALDKQYCVLCQSRLVTTLQLQRSLYRKYSSSQNHHYLTHFNSITHRQTIYREEQEEYLDSYHRSGSQIPAFARIRESYGIDSQLPRMFQPLFKNLLEKCYHRKKLLHYFKLAREMGLRVESVDYSSFLLSLHLGAGNSVPFSPLLQSSEVQG